MMMKRISCLSLAFQLALGCGASEEGLFVPLTVTADASLPRVVLRDGRLVHVVELGDPAAPAVIMLHGGPGGDSRSYLHFEDELADFRVILWDQRGSGLSERVPDDELNGPTFRDDLDELVERYGAGAPVALIGHSWGGALATYYTQAHPERVRRLVLVEPGALNAPAAKAGNTTAIDFGSARFQGFLQATDTLEPLSFAEADYFYVVALAGFKDDDTNLLGYEFWRLGYHANLAINRWQGNLDGSHTFNATDGIDAYAGPTLFITGTDDGRLGHDFQVEHHVPHFADATVVQLPDTEHSDLLLDERALEAIRGFLP